MNVIQTLVKMVENAQTVSMIFHVYVPTDIPAKIAVQVSPNIENLKMFICKLKPFVV